jgi:phage-related protein
MATFPDYKPVYGASKKSEPKTRRVAFGDGYEQRIAFGLNTNPKQWSLEFNLSEEDADIVEAFLDARAQDSQSFTWTPPGSNTAYKWICPTWDSNLFDIGRIRITTTFVQVFEP